MKKAILFVIDALAADVLIPAMDDGRLPNFKALTSQGVLRKNCISIFPSITPAALSAIITGKYPINTGVPGDYWYDEVAKTVNYFGADFSAIMGRGLESFLKDFLVKLNDRFLKADTLFQTLENHDLEAACINYFIHYGGHEYEVQLPRPIDLLPTGATSLIVKGPSMMHLGDLSKIELEDFNFSDVAGMASRFGFQDDTTLDILQYMVAQDRLPDFTVAYLPDNDWDSHELGPDNAVFTLQHIDKRLGELFDIKDGIDNFLDEYMVLIVGDHSQSPLVMDDEQRGINVNQILGDFNLVDAGTSWEEDDEMIACPNLRSTLFYFNRIDPDRFNRVIDRLLAQERIDQVIWRGSILGKLTTGYYVKTAKHGQLYFRDDADSPMAYDRYGGGWTWEGDLATVDGHVSDDNVLTFGKYPNAFERLKGVLDLERSGDLWATAKPGYTFHLDSMEYEKRGSHGALHRLDSTTSLIVAGHDDMMTIPQDVRIVDVAPLILQAFKLDTMLAGQSRVHLD